MMQMRRALPRGPLPDPERPYAPPAYATRSRPTPMFPTTLLRRVLTAAALAASLAQAAPTRLPNVLILCASCGDPTWCLEVHARSLCRRDLLTTLLASRGHEQILHKPMPAINPRTPRRGSLDHARDRAAPAGPPTVKLDPLTPTTSRSLQPVAGVPVHVAMVPALERQSRAIRQRGRRFRMHTVKPLLFTTGRNLALDALRQGRLTRRSRCRKTPTRQCSRMAPAVSPKP